MSKKTILTLLLITFLVIASVYFLLGHDRNTSPPSSKTNGSRDIARETTNYSPATPQEQEDSDSRKGDSNFDQTDESSSNSEKQTVTVVITTTQQVNGNITVNGRVVDVVEDGGICTLTLARGTQTVRTTREAVANVVDTSCGRSEVPLAKLSSGTWQATLSYSSAKYRGSSSPVSIEVNK